MEERLTMSNKEIDRLKVIQKVIDGSLTWREGGRQLDLSERQIGRYCVRVREEGNPGVIHGLRGQPSNHQLNAKVVEKALRIVQERYTDFGPTFAGEKLEEKHGIKISVFSLRGRMIEEGIWKAKKKGKRHRAWRERRSCVGELVQLDGSDHNWFEGRGERCVLLIYVDDATSRILYGEFVKVEDTLTLMRTTEKYLLKHGRPISFYVDKDSIYKVNRKTTIEEELEGNEPLTQFSRAMGELEIGVICAHSPQAKGRVERSFGTHQDRLVKELRLAGISTIAEANQFFWNVYIPKHNERFAVEPANENNAHRPLLPSHRLEEILSIRQERSVANDFTVRCQNQYFQILADQSVRVRPKDRVFVETRLNGSVHIRFGERYLNFKNIESKPYKAFYANRVQKEIPEKVVQPYRPPSSHPWKSLSYQKMIRKQKQRQMRKKKYLLAA